MRFSFDGPRDGFSVLGSSGLEDLSWSSGFSTQKADVFFSEHQLEFLNWHAAFDFLIACRNSLRVGGRIRIATADWNHASEVYRSDAGALDAKIKFDVKSLVNCLALVGMSPAPIEFHDESGRLHLLSESDFYKFGFVTRSSRVAAGADPDRRFSSLIVDGIKISDDRSYEIFDEAIYVIGDSHSRFLAGKDDMSDRVNIGCAQIYSGFSAKFIGCHVGPGLAYNLNKYETKTRVLEKIEQLLASGHIPKNARLMFSFGEIDCRFHVCRQSESQGRAIDDVVTEICAAYVEFLDKMHSRGYRPMVWAPFATTWADHWNDPEFPVYGSYAARRHGVVKLNQTMARLCKSRNYEFVSILDRVNDAAGNPIQKYFCDPIHLSQAARRFVHEMSPDGDFVDERLQKP